MSDETTQLIAGDAAVDAFTQPRRRKFFGRKRAAQTPLTHCENCGGALAGEYCAQCGQHAIDYRKSLFRVLLDAADSFLNWDTKFLKTSVLLLTKPWRLTNDFNAGRRVRYVHPLRIYLLASIIFFFLGREIKLQTGPIVLTAADRVELAAELGKLTGPDSVLPPEERARVDAARAKLAVGEGELTKEERDHLRNAFNAFVGDRVQKHFKKGESERVKAALRRVHTEPGPDAATPSEGDVPTPRSNKEEGGFQFNMGGNKGTETPFERWMEGRIKQKIGPEGTGSDLFFTTLRSNIPAMMFCCVPLFAFVLKILYLRKRRYYVEHLVYALHIHAFFYVGVIIIALLGVAVNGWQPALTPAVAVPLSFILAGQVFLSIRYVYGQGWFFTTVKFLLGGAVYLVILMIGIGTTAFITLLL